MRIPALFPLLLLFFFCADMHGTTWYVRADGGSRYSANALHGKCDGKADLAYPGRGVNQHCAFGDYRSLWDDQSYRNSKWVIAGGDTVILDNTKQWRVGFEGDGGATDVWCFGGDGPYSCTNPSIPPGTAVQHTRILGRNFAHCNVGRAADHSQMSQIFGGHGVAAVLNLRGAQNVDVQCIEVTRHSQCSTHGMPIFPNRCKTDLPIDDYDSDGVSTDTKTSNLLLEDVWVHGHTDRGIVGPIGGLVTALRVEVAYNGMVGWDLDDGDGTASVHATLKLDSSIIEWNGCDQEYPSVHKYPALSCHGQNSGGYGDGMGTPAHMGMDVYIDHSIFRYNTQDGEDFGHIDTGSHILRITNSLSYANNGGQFKWGPNFTDVVFENNLVLGNCARMAAPIAGTPKTFNAHLTDFCRAEDAVSFNFRQGGEALVANNTIVSYAPTTFDIDCWDQSCSSSTLTFENNVVMGYDNPATYQLGGKPGGPGGIYFVKPIGNVVRNSNLYFGLRSFHCFLNGRTNEICADPKFISEPTFASEKDLDDFNFHLSPASPARRPGVPILDLHSDFDGKVRPSQSNLGALQ